MFIKFNLAKYYLIDWLIDFNGMSTWLGYHIHRTLFYIFVLLYLNSVFFFFLLFSFPFFAHGPIEYELFWNRSIWHMVQPLRVREDFEVMTMRKYSVIPRSLARRISRGRVINFSGLWRLSKRVRTPVALLHSLLD